MCPQIDNCSTVLQYKLIDSKSHVAHVMGVYYRPRLD